MKYGWEFIPKWEAEMLNLPWWAWNRRATYRGVIAFWTFVKAIRDVQERQ